jgi:uncharacterized peroxidase-related enzyme
MAELSGQDIAMLEYAVRLTRNPGGMGAADVAALKAAGFDETGILDICQVSAYYNYVNRLADGLGVELESEWTDDEMTITHEEFGARHERSFEGADGDE